VNLKLKDSNIFLIPNNLHVLHLATIGYGLREFVCMLDRRTNKVYIEEVVLQGNDNEGNVWCNFKFIQEDELAFDLAKFCEMKGVLDMKKIMEKLIDMDKKTWIPKTQ